jgi:hypothetical protein
LRKGSEQQGSPRWLTRQDLKQVSSRLEQLEQRLE